MSISCPVPDKASEASPPAPFQPYLRTGFNRNEKVEIFILDDNEWVSEWVPYSDIDFNEWGS
jgi:hypothetical protein